MSRFKIGDRALTTHGHYKGRVGVVCDPTRWFHGSETPLEGCTPIFFEPNILIAPPEILVEPAPEAAGGPEEAEHVTWIDHDGVVRWGQVKTHSLSVLAEHPWGEP